jgi:hypothetical protein
VTTRERLTRVVAIAVGLAAVTALPTPVRGLEQAAPTGVAPVSPDEITVSLAAQSWFVPGTGNARLTVELATTGITALSDRRREGDSPVQFEIEVRAPITSREQLEAFLASTAPSSPGATGGSTSVIVDQRAVVDSVRIDLRDATVRRGQIGLSVVVEPVNDDDDELAMPQQGIHPLVIRVSRDGEVVAEIPTFAERLAWGAREPAAGAVTDLAILGRIDGRPTLRANGATQNDRAVIDELRRVRTVLESVPDLPVTLALRPELTDGLDRSSQIAHRVLREQLGEAIAERHLLSQPYVAMDASSMVAAGLDDVYIDELRRGEDTLADAFPQASAVRSVALVDDALTAAGADLLRDLGVRNVLLVDDAAQAVATRSSAAETAAIDASLGWNVALPGGGTLQAHAVDSALARRVEQGAAEPALAANHLVADLLLRQNAAAAPGAAIDGRALVITTSDTDLPDTDLLTAMATLVDADPRLRFSPLDAALSRAGVHTLSGSPVVIPTATSPSSSLAPLAERLAIATDDVTATGSMLPTGDERLQRWIDLLAIAPSDALDADEQFAYLTTTTDETAALRASVRPPAETTFTLGGRSGDVSLTLRNDASVPLTVVVRMSSPKLLFPEGPVTVELAADEATIVRIPVEARSNNTFPVTVEVLTPWQLLPVTPTVQLTARVTAFTGLGQAATGAAALILATWWMRHWRTNRRRLAPTTRASVGG